MLLKLCHKAAWKFVEDHKTEINWDLAFINPSVTFGPILGEATSPDKLGTSAAILYQVLMQNKLPALGYTHLWWADVRDVALAHVRALEVPEAGGQYFVTIAGAFDWQDWCMYSWSLSSTLGFTTKRNYF